MQLQHVIEHLVLSFYFVLFVLNVIVFNYNGLKQSLILQRKPNCYNFFFFIGTLCLFKKSILRCTYVERLGYEFGTVLVTFVDISYFASQICINSMRDTFLIPHTFLKTWVDNSIKFSTSILCTKKVINNYHTAHQDIRPQSDDEQGINKLQPKYTCTSVIKPQYKSQYMNNASRICVARAVLLW